MIGAYEDVEIHDFEDPTHWRSNASYFEAFDPVTEEWSDLQRNPFFSEWTKSYWKGASVTKENSFLIFGGWLNIYNETNSKLMKFHFMKTHVKTHHTFPIGFIF